MTTMPINNNPLTQKTSEDSDTWIRLNGRFYGFDLSVGLCDLCCGRSGSFEIGFLPIPYIDRFHQILVLV